MHILIRRQRAAQACVDAYVGKPPVWGTRDCLRLFRFVAHKMGVKVGKCPRYSTEGGAVRALKRSGFADLMAAVDGQGLARIAPAAALPGDIIALPADDVFGCALTVALGNGRVLGYFEGGCQVIEPKAFLTAWRIA